MGILSYVAGKLQSNGEEVTLASDKGLATAWVTFDGTTTPPTIKDSYNVTSVERVSTGIFKINFTTAMDNTNYSGAGTGDFGDNIPANADCPIISYARLSDSRSLGYVKVMTSYKSASANTFLEVPTSTFQIFGGK